MSTCPNTFLPGVRCWLASSCATPVRGCPPFPSPSFPPSARIKTAGCAHTPRLVAAAHKIRAASSVDTGEFHVFGRAGGIRPTARPDPAREDYPRQLGGKAPARAGPLTVPAFSREDERKLRIVFDNPAPGVLQPV